ncbi:MAG: DNA-binding protein [Chitinophagaceae bacterium]
MAYDNIEKKLESIYSKRIRAGKRRTYFFDVKSTRGNDYYLTITESRKRFNDNGYDRHKIFLYKEDFNKFIKALTEAVDYVKTELMPDFNFDAYNHDEPTNGQEGVEVNAEAEEIESNTPSENNNSTQQEEVDKW